MPPTSFWGLVIGFPALSTLRAEYFISYNTEVDFYLQTRDGEVDIIDLPDGRKSQQLQVMLG